MSENLIHRLIFARASTPRLVQDLIDEVVGTIKEHDALIGIVHRFHEKVWFGNDKIGYSMNAIEVKKFLRDTEQFARTSAGRVKDFLRELEIVDAIHQDGYLTDPVSNNI
jgi:hypothetical protein